MIKDEKNNKSNYGKFMLAIGSAALIGAIGVSACGVSNTATNTAASSPNTAVVKEQLANLPDKTSTVETPQTNAAPPRVLVDAGEFAENIYDFAKAKNWAKADERLARLEKAVADLKTQNLSTAQITETTSLLSTAVKAKNEMDAMRESNQATFLIAEQTAKFNLKVPVEVIKLDYYGREIERLAMLKDEAKLKSTTAEMRQTWNAVKLKVEAKGASKVAAKFESLVAQTEKAVSVADYAKVATPILDEVDNLENVFEK